MLSGLESPTHIAILLVILVVLFGAKRLPDIGRSMGSGLREFKQAITGEAPQHLAGAQPPAGDGRTSSVAEGRDRHD